MSAYEQYCFVYQEWDMLRERSTVVEDRVEKIVTPTMQDTAFSTRMQEARIRLRLTIHELAERVGLPSRTISMYENGSEMPSDHAASQIKIALGMS